MQRVVADGDEVVRVDALDGADPPLHPLAKDARHLQSDYIRGLSVSIL